MSSFDTGRNPSNPLRASELAPQDGTIGRWWKRTGTRAINVLKGTVNLTAGTAIKTIYRGGRDILGWGSQRIVNTAKNTVSGVSSVIGGTINTIGKTIAAPVEGLANLTTGSFELLAKAVRSFVMDTKNKVGDLISRPAEGIKEALDGR